MKYPKIIISFLLSVILFYDSQAQEKNKYVYQDSSVQTEDTEIAQSDKTIANVATLPDTILRFNNLVLPKDSIIALKNSPDFAYAKNLDNLLKEFQQKQISLKNRKVVSGDSTTWLDNFFDATITKIFLWSFAGLFILFVLYKFFFAQDIFKKEDNNNKLTEIDENIKSDGTYDYDRLVQQSINENNYRLATRYLYLQSLQELSMNGLVQLGVDKTNLQYLTELNGTIYKEEFSWLTLNYEYIWYGEFNLGSEFFMQLQSSFKHFNNQLHKR